MKKSTCPGLSVRMRVKLTEDRPAAATLIHTHIIAEVGPAANRSALNNSLALNLADASISAPILQTQGQGFTVNG